jgi:DNA-binding CsgD family transcriptional regulator
VVVGRAAELDALVAALDAARGGRGRVVFMVGEGGIGKSRLVHEVASNAAERGVPVLRGRAVPGSRTSAFRPLAEALAGLAADSTLGRPDMQPWLPALAGLVPAVTPPAAEQTTSVRGEAVIRLLRSVCTPGGGLLVLEDLHWADPESLAVVEHLSDHLDRAPVLCLATVRSDEESPARDLVRRVDARRSAQVVALGRLDEAQVTTLVQECTGGTTVDALHRVVELCDGVPFLAEELLVSPGLPASMADGVVARLDQLTDTDRRVLVTAAAFGSQFDWRLLSDATAQEEADVVDALDRGVRAQLLTVDGDEFKFRHALTAEAVLQSVIPPRRRACASAALAALDAAYPRLPDALRDVAAPLAERAGHRERAGRLLLAASDEALAHGALHTAVVALERASQLLGAGPVQDRVGERLVEALSLAGRVEDALRVGRQVVDSLPPAAAAAVRLRLAGAAITAARWEVAGEQLAEARRLLDGGESAALRAELALREGELALGTGDSGRAEERARVALDLARVEEVAEVECAALQVLGRCARRSSLEAAEDWFRLALGAAEAHGLALWRLRALHEIGTIGLLDRSEVGALLESQRQAVALGAMATAAILDIEIAAGYASVHDLDAAARHGRQAVRRGTELGLELVVAYGWHHVAGAAALRGDPDQAAAAAAAARAAAPGNRDIDGMLVGATDLVIALMADDDERALAAAARCADLLRGSGTAPPMHFRTAWPLLRAVDHHAQAAAAVEELDQAGLSVSRACRGSLTMTRAMPAGPDDPGQAAALAVAADAELAFVSWWRHVVRRFAAAAAAADGWTVPDGWMDESEEWLRRHGNQALGDACAVLRSGRTGRVPSRWARLGVTPREADVLTLVVEGCSNREIAERLYLSVRTVEKHVESLLRRTGTRSRTQLALVAATTEATRATT